ncbi:Crp/Fnr family transcriptional regulator [Flavivirga algicola]|uniref:Crp/Fnr family transcriptional regulator n=1 Tax=Flavivirga algicola TaxID=2729136 RepID=A0ABX1RUY7_9FLAO|nr:Crp/Fnr family transcriptional regulator [Flavivirga algicola]NMH87357.1 Crp/Fnr family transcriptional regulator [Flavivirga algicola]
MKNILKLIEELEGQGKRKVYDQKQVFVREGEIPNKIGFIKKGLFRYYYLTNEGKEFTKVFMKEGDIISSYTSMISREKSYYTIEAIEKSEIIQISLHQWNKLRRIDSKWDKLLIAFLEKGYGIKEKREREFLLLDSENRYKAFLEEYPNLENRVRQHMIASYLGITPIALSRIRRKMKHINLC